MLPVSNAPSSKTFRQRGLPLKTRHRVHCAIAEFQPRLASFEMLCLALNRTSEALMPLHDPPPLVRGRCGECAGIVAASSAGISSLAGVRVVRRPPKQAFSPNLNPLFWGKVQRVLLGDADGIVPRVHIPQRTVDAVGSRRVWAATKLLA